MPPGLLHAFLHTTSARPRPSTPALPRAGLELMFRVHFETKVRLSVSRDTREPAAVMRSYFVKLALLASFPLLALSCNVNQSGPVSVGKAISNASATTGVHRVDRSAGKLMQRKELQSDSGWAPA